MAPHFQQKNVFLVNLVEFATLTVENGHVVFKPYSDDAIDALLKEEKEMEINQ